MIIDSRGCFEFTSIVWIILVRIETQKARGCLQLAVCRVFSLLSSYQSLDPAIDSGGLDIGSTFERLCLNYRSYGDFIHSVCACVFQQVVWSPEKDAWDKNVSFNSSEDRPRCKEGHCQEVKLEEVVPFLQGHPYLYHGGAIKSDWFAKGIDFSKAGDKITGPVFFTTHNIFHALLYSASAMFDWGELELDRKVEDKKVPWSDFYRPVMEFEIQHLDQCQGLVPDMDFLQKAADQGKDKIEKFMETQCGGHKCSFLAVNWNEDSKKGSGLLPYEIRMLPGSVETCGMKLKKIIMVMSSLYDKFFDDEAPQYLKATGIAAKLYQKSIGQENSTGTP